MYGVAAWLSSFVPSIVVSLSARYKSFKGQVVIPQTLSLVSPLPSVERIVGIRGGWLWQPIGCIRGMGSHTGLPHL